MPFVLEHCYRMLEVAFEKVAVSLEIEPLLQEREWSTRFAARLSEELYEYFGCLEFLVWRSMAQTFEPLVSVFAAVAGAEAVAGSAAEAEFEAVAAVVAVGAVAVEAVAAAAEPAGVAVAVVEGHVAVVAA